MSNVGQAMNRGCRLLSSLPRGPKRIQPKRVPSIQIPSSTASISTSTSTSTSTSRPSSTTATATDLFSHSCYYRHHHILPTFPPCRQLHVRSHNTGRQRTHSVAHNRASPRVRNWYNNSNNNNNTTTTTRNHNLRGTRYGCLAGETTRRPFSKSSSSSSFVDRLKKSVEDTAKSVARQASEKVHTTAEKATETAKQAVSETLESTQKAALRTKDKAIRTVSSKASEAAEGVAKATSETLKSTMAGAHKYVARSAPVETISKSTRVLSSGIEETTLKATHTAQTIARSSVELKENLVSTSTKAVRWLWWWSLAAIFVYGVASTLPMAIIRYTIDQKKNKNDNNNETVVPKTTQEEPPHDAESHL